MSLDSPGRRTPDDLVQLQLQARRPPRFEDPARQIPRLHLAVRGREEHRQLAPDLERVELRDGPMEVGLAGDDHLDLVALDQRLEDLERRVRLLRAGRLEVDDLLHTPWNPLE